MIVAKTAKNGTCIKVTSDYDPECVIEIMDEFAAIIKYVRDVVSENHGEEYADVLISTCGWIAYSKNDEEMEEAMNDMSDFIHSDIEKMLQKIR